MYMNYYNECRIHAKNGLDDLIKYLEEHNKLIYNREVEKNCGKYGDDIICIEVEILDDNEGTDFIGTYEFTESGNFIE